MRPVALVHEARRLDLEGDEQVAGHGGGQVVERLGVVGEAEGTHAEGMRQRLAELWRRPRRRR